VARALIVGCGCLGTELARKLAADGWAVRGSSRTGEGAARIESAGIHGVVADPDRVGTVLDHVGDVTVVAWALGGASGSSARDVNGARLERMLERLVDTPVRGFVLDSPPDAPAARMHVEAASSTWRIPARVVDVSRADNGRWVRAMVKAVNSLVTETG
jgi:uncharacterized protein YbjT (DUF2867 family)